MRGAWLAVVESVAKLVASGFRYEDAYLTFQEYFERLGAEPERWGKPLAALLGALDAQMDLGHRRHRRQGLACPAPSRSMDVPPTLVSLRRRPSATPAG